jgi:hypothetical protein
MNTRRIRGAVATTASLLAALAAVVVPAGQASADTYEHGFTATVDQVLVNRYGGITVSGQLDCSAQVAAVYGGSENIPADTTVYVGKQWTATQYVGRGKAVSASYSSGIASVCFTNDPGMYGGDVTAPWPWATLYGFPVGTTQWVYADNGKFAAGAIHVELTVDSVTLMVGEDEHYFYSFSGWDVRVVKVR